MLDYKNYWIILYTHFKNINQQVDLIHIQNNKINKYKKGKKIKRVLIPYNLNNPLIYYTN